MNRRELLKAAGLGSVGLAFLPLTAGAAEAADGDVAGYALFWFDPITAVGLVEPVRVEEQYWRRGLARAMLTTNPQRILDDVPLTPDPRPLPPRRSFFSRVFGGG